MISEKNIVLYVGFCPHYIKQVLKKSDQNFTVMLLSNDKKAKNVPDVDILEYVDFSKPHKIAQVLMPYYKRIIAVTTNGDVGVNMLTHVIPHLPYLRTPSTESLRWATDKYEMRKRLNLFDPEITPRFTKVKENTKKERQRVVEKVGFPMVIKPANLASSLLVSICYHEEELTSVLRKTFWKINKLYANNKRNQIPVVIAEGFMEGDMYSIDSYVDSRGNVSHCPLVKVLRGTDVGHDDLYNYMHLTPSGLRKTSCQEAERAAEKAIVALALRNTTTHIEFIKSDDVWRIIEIGARPGGFRHVIHDLSSGINHALNDIKIRIPQKPVLTKVKNHHAVALKWFAKKEGKIIEMQGIKKIENLESFDSIKINKSVGSRSVFSKNGGKSIFHIFLTNKTRSRLLADIRRVEKYVNIKID